MVFDASQTARSSVQPGSPFPTASNWIDVGREGRLCRSTGRAGGKRISNGCFGKRAAQNMDVTDVARERLAGREKPPRQPIRKRHSYAERGEPGSNCQLHTGLRRHWDSVPHPRPNVGQGDTAYTGHRGSLYLCQRTGREPCCQGLRALLHRKEEHERSPVGAFVC